MNIGGWVIRERRGMAHLTESIVAGDVVTKCGRRLTDEPTKTGGPLIEFWARTLDGRCKQCLGPVT